MSKTLDPNLDHDDDDGPGQEIAPASSGALTSLEALAKALNNVCMTTTSGRSFLPMLKFASRENGVWAFGQKKIEVENGSKWAVNPRTFQHGYISFSPGKKQAGERLVSIAQPMPVLADLPDTGLKWDEEWAVNLKCTTGTDTGVEVVWKATTNGGYQAINMLMDAIRDRINGGQHDGHIVPIVQLEKDSYQHPEHGRICTPLLTIVGWMSPDGPAPETAPAPKTAASKPASSASKPEPAEQPRRRRITA
jgi:hypothetical protein